MKTTCTTKILAWILACMMLLALAACDSGTEPPSGDGQDTTTKETDPTDSTVDGQDAPTETEGDELGACGGFCYDLESPADRKCDQCGNWIHPKGEVWTSEIPENIRVVLNGSTFGNDGHTIVEKLGDRFYVKEWIMLGMYEEDLTPDEFYITLDKTMSRNLGNESQKEWGEAMSSRTYGDVYQICAKYIFGGHTGGTMSQMISECLEISSEGTETIAGKECVIKTYEGFGTVYRLWLWNNIPLKMEYRMTNETEYTLSYEILEWDTGITAFSEAMPD